MKVTLWGIHDAPESTGIAPFNRDLGEYRVDCGHAVTTVAAFSCCPRWRKNPGARGRWSGAEEINGVKIHRCGCCVPAPVTTLRRIAHELSFGLGSMLHLLTAQPAEIYVAALPAVGVRFSNQPMRGQGFG